MTKTWTPAQDQLLRDFYCKVPTKDLAASLEKTLAAVKNRVTTLQLHQKTLRHWTEADRALMRRVYPSGDLKALAAELGRSVADLRRQAWQLGLKREAVAVRPDSWRSQVRDLLERAGAAGVSTADVLAAIPGLTELQAQKALHNVTTCRQAFSANASGRKGQHRWFAREDWARAHVADGSDKCERMARQGEAAVRKVLQRKGELERAAQPMVVTAATRVYREGSKPDHRYAPTGEVPQLFSGLRPGQYLDGAGSGWAAAAARR